MAPQVLRRAVPGSGALHGVTPLTCADSVERQASTRRQIAHHVGKLGALGFEVTLCRIPGPEPGEPASTPAA